MNQIEDQVEVPDLTPNRASIHLIAYSKAALGALQSSQLTRYKLSEKEPRETAPYHGRFV